MNQDYLCTYLGHEREVILGFCMNLNCQKKTQFCYKCVDINHSDHKNQCISFNQIHESIQSFQVIGKDWQQRIKAEFEKVHKEYLNISKFLQNELLNMMELDKKLTNHQYYQFQQELPNLKKWSIISQAQVSSNNLLSTHQLYVDMLSELNQLMIANKVTKIEKLQNVEAKNSLDLINTANIEVYWDQKLQEFPIRDANMNLYEAIRGLLNLSDIVIYCNYQICSQSNTFADIFQKEQSCDQYFLFNVKKSPELLESEINGLQVLIEKQKNEINDQINKLKIFEENERRLKNQINMLSEQNQLMIANKVTKAKNPLYSTNLEGVVVYWDQKLQQFPITNVNKNLYQAIRDCLNISDIVIYCNDQICSQSNTFADIFQTVQSCNQEFVFNVKKSPEVLEGEIKKLKVLIEKQKIDIIELKIFQENENKLNNQINELKKQVESLQQPTYCKSKSLGKNKVVDYAESGLIMDDQRKIVPQEFIQHLIQKKSQELDSLKIFQSLIQGSTRNNNNSIIYSMAIEQQYACDFCNSLITEDIIELSCFHCFHNQCFDQLIQGQISLGQPYFTCICSVKLKPREIFSLSNKDAAEIYKLQMLQSQLKRIKDSDFGFFKCPKKYCPFFYKHDQNQPNQNSYCPACLE